jgi:transcriptional regulator with XRE-family HTH domain
VAGRPPIEIDYDAVEVMAGNGLTQEEIALALGISLSTVTRRIRDSADFDEAIKRGKAKAAAEVANLLMELCRKRDLGAIVWFEKTRRGLSDKMTHGFSGDIDWTKVPDAVLDAYRAGTVTIDDVRRSTTSS